jgi:hypothetical protein
MNTGLDQSPRPWPWIAGTSPATTAGVNPEGQSLRVVV